MELDKRTFWIWSKWVCSVTTGVDLSQIPLPKTLPRDSRISGGKSVQAPQKHGLNVLENTQCQELFGFSFSFHFISVGFISSLKSDDQKEKKSITSTHHSPYKCDLSRFGLEYLVRYPILSQSYHHCMTPPLCHQVRMNIHSPANHNKSNLTKSSNTKTIPIRFSDHSRTIKQLFQIKMHLASKQSGIICAPHWHRTNVPEWHELK